MKENNKENIKKNPVKEIKYHFSWINKVLLFLTLPFWILPVIIINLIIGKKIRDSLQDFPKKGLVPFEGFEGINFNSLEFYNRDMELKNAPKELLISAEEWAQINPENVDILTFDNTTLSAFLLVNKKPTKKWIIVLHGWIQNRYNILYLAKHFYQAGYNVLVYDARNHGSNPNTSCTFGLKEARDLFFVLKYLRQKYQDKNLEFVLIGNSMGASTILQALVRYDLTAMGVKSAIFDCGYDDFTHMLKVLSKTRIKYHWFWYYYGLNFWLFFKDKFKIDQIKPVDRLQNCSKTPVLFIHGSCDQTVPLTMSKRLYKIKIKYEIRNKNKKLSELLIVDNAGHVVSALTDYPLYTETTLKFVAKWFDKKIHRSNLIMIYYINQSKDPYYNLALEELLTKDETITDEILLLWQNDNTIVVGVNQNTIEEINNDYVKQHDVNVVRRLSGGGAVYQDLGNLNFTFIFNKNEDNVRNYALFTKPIIDVLQKLGLDAKFSGKNDIEVDGKKISGNAQYNYKNRIMHHGTILFDVDMTILPQVLKPDLVKLQSKGIKSVKARVTNILPLLTKKITVEEFKNLIVQDLQNTKQAKIIFPSDKLVAKAKQLADKKYRTWEWNYGRSPAFNLENKARIEGKGTIDVRVNVEAGLIKAIKIYGDFLGSLGTKGLEDKLVNQPYQMQNLCKLISEEEIKAVFGSNFTKDEVLNVLIK